MASARALTSLAGALAVLPTAFAGFDASSQSNMAIYWGKNDDTFQPSSYADRVP